ncbi:MAG TPA: serine protease [Thermoanaerobaculia bacterium]|nr:serine protease [Thermoanaerobaculia bacterium]
MQRNTEELIALAKEIFPSPVLSLESVEAGTLDERVQDGAAVLQKIHDGETDLTPADEIALEAIILVVGRPALLVQDNDFAEPPGEWAHLVDKRDMLQDVFPAVGRVELTGHHSFEWCGTAFLAGDGILMTNKHVVQIFAEPHGSGWTFLPGVTARIDYREEFERPEESNFAIDRVLAVHPFYDLALLSVTMDGAPRPLTLMAEQPSPVRDREVATIGYPALDSHDGRTEQIEVFQNIFDVKRLLPGKTTGLRGNPAVLGHDCSTLGGNSGSAVVDLEKGHVIALHFGGQFLIGNFSVPLWTLKDDVTLRHFDLNWAKPKLGKPHAVHH